MHIRFPHLDLLRILATFGVIFIHIIDPMLPRVDEKATLFWQSINIGDSISRAAVPLFFMISGALLLARPETAHVQSFIRNRALKIGIPFLIWSIFYGILSWYTQDSTPKDIIHSFFTEGTYNHLWFMYPLLAMYLLAPALYYYTHNAPKLTQKIVLGLLLFSGAIFPLLLVIFGVNDRFSSTPFSTWFFYMLAGYFIVTFPLTKNELFMFTIAGTVGLLYSINVSYALSGDTAGSAMFYFKSYGSITIVSYSVMVFALTHRVALYIKPLIPTKQTRKRIIDIASLCYGVYLIHPAIIALLPALIQDHLNGLNPFAYVGIMLVVVTFTSYTIIVAWLMVKRFYTK